MARLPPLNALRAFEAAGRHLNFRLAAEEIGVTQGAVAQQVRQLEARLERKLFERLPRGLALTDQGRTYHAPLRRAFAILAEATEAIHPETSKLTISVPPSFATRWLVPRLNQFSKQHPAYDVHVVASHQLADFKHDGVDIAVRQSSPPFDPELNAELLYPLEVYPVCSPALQAGKHPIRRPADLMHHTLLQEAHGYWPAFLEEHLRDEATLPVDSINFNQISLAIDAAIHGQGVAMASDALVEEQLASGELCRPLKETVQGDSGYYIVMPQRAANHMPSMAMRDWLIAQSKAGAPARP